ncbi:MAG: lysoplasmalogenase [Mycoplasmataceae bacterium]|nr:lysoplasmalogenase [Mycoplasmataceae bacterium]
MNLKKIFNKRNFNLFYIASSVIFLIILLTLACLQINLNSDKPFRIASIIMILFMSSFSIFGNGIKLWKQEFKNNFLIFLAIIFCTLSESAKLIPNIGIYWVIFFFGTHICLGLFFLKLRPFKKTDTILLSFLLIVGIFFYISLFQYFHNDSQGILLKIGVPFYLLVLIFSLWRVLLCYENPKALYIIIGVVLFHISDYIVITTLVANNNEDPLSMIVWLTYIIAIWLISIFDKNVFQFEQTMVNSETKSE